jgi:hypothetical protein
MTALYLGLMILSAPMLLQGQRPVVEQALSRLYNFDFPGAHRILDEHIRQKPDDPAGYGFRAAVLLFHELDRLGVLESEFFADDKKIVEKKKLKPDPNIREAFFGAVSQAESRAQARLKLIPDDKDSLFVLCVTRGLVTDYASLIDKRQLSSLGYAKQSHNYALRLLQIDPNFNDAYLTTGLSEYLVGSLPFFIRWFIRFDKTEGSKQQAVQNLELVARSGRYFGPFARILLAIIHLREKRPAESERLLAQLCRDFPENGLFKRELEKVSAIVKNGSTSVGGR